MNKLTNQDYHTALSTHAHPFWTVVALVFGTVLLIGLFFFFPFDRVRAASPTPVASPRPTTATKASPSLSPSSSPSASPSEQATENLKDRIDRILEQRQEKLRELEQAGQKRRVFVGEVQRITERTVTIRTQRGNQSFTVGPEVDLAKGGKKATIDDVAVGDWLGVVGFLDKETIQPQLVVISGVTLSPTKYETVIGTIKEFPRNQIVITDPTNNERTFSISRTTAFQNNEGTVIKQTALETETQAIIVAKPEGDIMPAVLIKSLAGQR